MLIGNQGETLLIQSEKMQLKDKKSLNISKASGQKLYENGKSFNNIMK
jgi:hypothetical protein